MAEDNYDSPYINDEISGGNLTLHEYSYVNNGIAYIKANIIMIIIASICLIIAWKYKDSAITQDCKSNDPNDDDDDYNSNNSGEINIASSDDNFVEKSVRNLEIRQVKNMQ
jgi:hypothetical protein